MLLYASKPASGSGYWRSSCLSAYMAVTSPTSSSHFTTTSIRLTQLTLSSSFDDSIAYSFDIPFRSDVNHLMHLNHLFRQSPIRTFRFKTLIAYIVLSKNYNKAVTFQIAICLYAKEPPPSISSIFELEVGSPVC